MGNREVLLGTTGLDNARFDPGVFVAEVVGLSLALSALFAQGAFLSNLRITTTGLWAVYALTGLVAVAGLLHRFGRAKALGRGLKRAAGPQLEAPAKPLAAGRQASWLRGGLLLLGFTGLLAWRFYQVRDLALPAWVDSVHHTLIVRVILERGGLPATLEPYLPVPFYYHFAFHAITAAWAALSSLPPFQGVLWLGQVLNAAVALSIYRLGISLWGDWRRAGAAALLVGFVSQMPAYYATWGRYTLLTGLVLLPLAFSAALEIYKHGPSPGRAGQLAVLTAGILLAHYYAAALLALFFSLLIVPTILQARGQKDNFWKTSWFQLMGGALLGLSLAGPWLWRAWSHAGGYLQAGVVLPVSQAADSAYFPGYPAYLWRLLGPARNQLLLYLALPGLLIAAWRPRTRVFATWAILLGLLSLPWGLVISPFRPDHAVIVLFLPLVLFSGDVFVTGADFLILLGGRLRLGRIAWVAALPVALALLALLARGLSETRSIVNSGTVLADETDLQAAAWVVDNLPQEARFLINVIPWQYGIYRGMDGGWWLTPLTGRATLLPPALYTLGEPDYVARINFQAEKASRLETCTPEFWELVDSAGLTHVYLHAGRSRLAPTELGVCSGLEKIYQNEDVRIYAIKDGVISDGAIIHDAIIHDAINH